MSYKSKTLFIVHLKRIILFLAIWGVYILLGLPCPVLWILGIPCPTCGVTRALFSLLQCDFKSYLHYQPMAVFLLIAILLLFHYKIIKYKKFVISYVGIVLFINTALYIVKIYNLMF